MKILAGVFQGGDKRIRPQEIDLAEPGPSEVLVKIVACGVCHTDIAAVIVTSGFRRGLFKDIRAF